MLNIKKLLKNILVRIAIVDFSSQIESSAVNMVWGYKVGDMCFLFAQGNSTTHAAGDVVLTIPEAYRPARQVFAPFTANALTYGNVSLNPNGTVTINQINNSSVGASRLYFQIFWKL